MSLDCERFRIATVRCRLGCWFPGNKGSGLSWLSVVVVAVVVVVPVVLVVVVVVVTLIVVVTVVVVVDTRTMSSRRCVLIDVWRPRFRERVVGCFWVCWGAGLDCRRLQMTRVRFRRAASF